MNTRYPLLRAFASLAGVVLASLSLQVRADVITDWNQRSARIVAEARIGTPPAVRVMALVQTAAYQAARDASHGSPASEPALDAAVAAAHRITLTQLLPAQQATIEAMYRSAIGHLPDDDLRVQQVLVGERAAQRVLAERADELPRTPNDYRPYTTAGMYVPTVIPAVPLWPMRKTWLLERADQFRPGPPPALFSERWARDFNETKVLGARDSKRRSAEQTAIGRFWDYSLPAIYHGVVQSVALQPGRGVLANARLFATVAQAMDDAMIAVLDAKYHHAFWRPVTAIRNGDADARDDTQREADWSPLIETPLHPEYPCAHCILAGTVASVLKAEGRERPLPVLRTTSPTAQGAERSWDSLDAFMHEVAQARIFGGVHYRNSTEVGLSMGQQIGAGAVARSDSLAH